MQRVREEFLRTRDEWAILTHVLRHLRARQEQGEEIALDFNDLHAIIEAKRRFLRALLLHEAELRDFLR